MEEYAQLSAWKEIWQNSVCAAEDYEACLTTTIYGQQYLDPIKCKERGFDPIAACEAADKDLERLTSYMKQLTEEKGWEAAFDLFYASAPEAWRGERGDVSMPSLKKRKVPEKKKKKKPLKDLLSKAADLVGRVIKFGDGNVKVLSVKMTEKDIFLGVEENVDGNLEFYDILYEEGMVAVF